MKQPQLIGSLSKEFSIDLSADDHSLCKKILIEKINELLQHDFNKLISILYRIDVDERKLKKLLNDNKDKDAAFIISELIIERQLQKIDSLKKFNSRDPIDEEESW